MTQPASELTGAPSQPKPPVHMQWRVDIGSCSDNPDLVWDARTGIIATTLKAENGDIDRNFRGREVYNDGGWEECGVMGCRVVSPMERGK